MSPWKRNERWSFFFLFGPVQEEVLISLSICLISLEKRCFRHICIQTQTHSHIVTQHVFPWNRLPTMSNTRVWSQGCQHLGSCCPPRKKHPHNAWRAWFTWSVTQYPPFFHICESCHLLQETSSGVLRLDQVALAHGTMLPWLYALFWALFRYTFLPLN